MSCVVCFFIENSNTNPHGSKSKYGCVLLLLFCLCFVLSVVGVFWGWVFFGCFFWEVGGAFPYFSKYFNEKIYKYIF